MKYLFSTLILICFLNTQKVQCQETNHLASINKDVWEKFSLAFESLDYTLMAEIHSKELARITGNNKQIRTYSEYISGNKSSFEWSKTNKKSIEVTLRFFERIANDHSASDRGIYRTTMNKGEPDEHISYGQFFVLLKKENGIWKILMDYDSNENNSVGETEYMNAFAMDDFEKFK